MNKLIMGIALAGIVLTTSCSKKAGEATDAENAVPAALSDSISEYYGKTVGGYLLSDLSRFKSENKDEKMKSEMLKGIQMAMSQGDSEGRIIGLTVGANILREIQQFEQQGIKIDKAVVLNNIRRAFADSLDLQALQENSAMMNTLMTQANRLMQQAKEAERTKAPDAQQNAKAGKEYIEAQKAKDPEIKTTKTGLSYKIITPGDDTRITDDNLVEVAYTGTFTDGKVFDQTTGDNYATFSPKSVVPGFGEGLKLLGKGGKAILYIPGELAYGVDGIPQAGIGPNQTLIFEVEVKDVK